MRVITFVNLSSVVTEADFEKTVAALQVQVNRDFLPAWGIPATLKTAKKGEEKGEVIYIQDDADEPGALGYHELSQKDAPVGFVFAKTCIDNGESWSSCASHELLEQLLDPFVNATFIGPIKGKLVDISYEVADPVENDTYLINGVAMSNFILPMWGVTDPAPAKGTKFDFLGKLTTQFSMSKGGYMAYTADRKNWEQVFADKIPGKLEPDAKYYRPNKDKRTPNFHVAEVKKAYFEKKAMLVK